MISDVGFAKRRFLFPNSLVLLDFFKNIFLLFVKRHWMFDTQFNYWNVQTEQTQNEKLPVLCWAG